LFNKKSDIVFIGAGKVAHTLIPLLIKNDYKVKGIISRHDNSASSISRKFKLDFYSSGFNSIPLKEGIFFITVPDSQIIKVAAKMASLNLNFKKCLFVHTSGSEGSSALKTLQRKGGVAASFHIMQTFPSLKQTDIVNSFAAIETKDKTAEAFLFSLARTLKLKSFRLTEAEKVYYHIAGVFTSNFLNANFFTSGRLLKGTTLGGEQHYKLFEPIIKTTLSNIENNGVTESLSGPVQRGDYLTVQKHLSSLKKLRTANKKLYLHSYISQSLILLEIIKQKGKRLTAGQAKLKKILEAELRRI
jgi:predicted short-subunit dehydrogenase-like oxidoreductase (DUF2520 family)